MHTREIECEEESKKHDHRASPKSNKERLIAHVMGHAVTLNQTGLNKTRYGTLLRSRTPRRLNHTP